jgi:type II secretory pathway component PulF
MPVKKVVKTKNPETKISKNAQQSELLNKETLPVKSVEVIVSKKEETVQKKSLFAKIINKETVHEETKERKIEAPSAPVTATPMVPKGVNEKKAGFFDTFGLSKERDQFVENLTMLVLSGMTITGAMNAIAKETKNPKMKKILETIVTELEAGFPLWRSFEKTGLFKGYTISLIRIGEESGKFAENLKVVALEQEKERGFKSKVKSALMYPVFVLALTAFIGIGISWFILPKLAKIFVDLKLTLPLVTRILMSFGVFLNAHGVWAVPLGLFVVIIVSYVCFYAEKTKFIGEAIMFSIPGINTLMMEVEVARFGYLLGTLLEAGIPITKAIDSLVGASEVIRYKKFYTHLKDSIEMGNSFQKSFIAYSSIDKLIPTPIQQLIISGEQSGNLNKTLIKVGQVLEEKSDTTTKNLTIIMEPILLVIVWAGVVSVAFAVILPIYSLVGGLNNA